MASTNHLLSCTCVLALLLMLPIIMVVQNTTQ
jgi:hypothetical protein